MRESWMGMTVLKMTEGKKIWEDSESVGYVGEESAGWERAGSPYQSQLEKLEALREVKAEIQHYSHQRTGP
jgi:hypothetical protein